MKPHPARLDNALSLTARWLRISPKSSGCWWMRGSVEGAA
jgi:hypothetical protein